MLATVFGASSDVSNSNVPFEVSTTMAGPAQAAASAAAAAGAAFAAPGFAAGRPPGLAWVPAGVLAGGTRRLPDGVLRLGAVFGGRLSFGGGVCAAAPVVPMIASAARTDQRCPSIRAHSLPPAHPVDADPRPQLADGADAAPREHGTADVLPPGHEIQVNVSHHRCSTDRYSACSVSSRRRRSDPAQAIRDAVDVRVDADVLLTLEGENQHQVRGLAAHTGQCRQLLHVRGTRPPNLVARVSAVAFTNRACCGRSSRDKSAARSPPP